MRSALPGIVLAASLLGCASLDKSACDASEQFMVSEMLYFGMAKPTGGIVTQDEWTAFLRTVVTPRFPAGLTAWPASGQWRGADGHIVREDSYVMNVLHPADATAEREIQAIVAEYKTRFAQEAVLRVKSGACTSF
jgi:hypothetical protein